VQKETSLISVVDDEESVRKALGRLIRAAGFPVETFSSGIDFLHSLRRREPHCVVLDLRMPVVNGFDIQRALRQAHSDIAVVIITGDDSTESRDRTLQQGAVAYLRKPVDEAMLLEALYTAIRSRPSAAAASPASTPAPLLP
jgi:FixJ family two-component response regulator